MHKLLFLFLGLFAVFTTGVLAQNNSQTPSGPNATTRLSDLETGFARFMESDDEIVTDPTGRPRIVTVKAADVKASVVVDTISAERVAFELINRQRQNSGLSTLEWNEEIAAIARLHSQNMAEFNFFSHRGLDSKMVSDRADDKGLRKWRAIGENIAFNRGYKDPIIKAVELWLNSPSHRRNMLDNNWKESAVGVAVAKDGSYYFTQVFWVRK